MAASDLKSLQNSLGRKWLLRQPSLFVYWLPKHPVFLFTPYFNTVNQATSSYLLLTMQDLCELRDVMPCHQSPGTSHLPFTASATDLRERFLISCDFYLSLLPAPLRASLGPAVHPQRQQRFMLIIEKQLPPVSNDSNPQKRYSGRFYLCV